MHIDVKAAIFAPTYYEYINFDSEVNKVMIFNLSSTLAVSTQHLFTHGD